MSEIDIEKELKKILTQAYQIPVNVLAFIHLLHKEWREQKQRIAELEEIIQYERLEAAEQAVIELGIQLEEMKKREDEFMVAEKRIRESLLNQLKEKDAEIERLKDYERSRVAANKPLKDKS